MATSPINLPNVTRRTFVKGAAATAAAAGMLGTSTWLSRTTAEAAGESAEETVAYCWHKTHCQGACGLRCTTRDGRLALLQPNDKIPNKRYSKICLKGISEIQPVELPENRDHSRFCGVTTCQPVPELNAMLAPQRFGNVEEGLFVPRDESQRRALMREHVAQIETPRVASYCFSCDAGLALGGADSASILNLLFDKSVPA